MKFASGVAAAKAMVLDGTNIYIADGISAVQSVSTVNGTVRSLAVNQEAPYSVAFDDEYVYWSNHLGGAIKRTPKDGSGWPELVVPANMPNAIGVFGDNVYWFEDAGTALWQAAKTGGAATNVLEKVIATGNTVAGSIDSAGIYYVYPASWTLPTSVYSLFGNWSYPIVSTTSAGPSGVQAFGSYVLVKLVPIMSRNGINYQARNSATGEVIWAKNSNTNAAMLAANSCGFFEASENSLWLVPMVQSGYVVDFQRLLPFGVFGVTAATLDKDYLYFFYQNSIYRLPLP